MGPAYGRTAPTGMWVGDMASPRELGTRGLLPVLQAEQRRGDAPAEEGPEEPHPALRRGGRGRDADGAEQPQTPLFQGRALDLTTPIGAGAIDPGFERHRVLPHAGLPGAA